MNVELTTEWMGHRPGTILNLLPPVANKMIQQNRAKEIEAAPADKQVKSAPKNKQFMRRNK
jgi:hypothetical protein